MTYKILFKVKMQIPTKIFKECKKNRKNSKTVIDIYTSMCYNSKDKIQSGKIR